MLRLHVRAFIGMPAACVLVIACGGGSEPSSPPAPPAPPAPVVPPTVVNGVVYARSDSVAWPADVGNVAGLPNVLLTLNSATANTTTTGAFSLQATIAVTPDAVPVTATAPGYVPVWSPWRSVEASQSMAIGLYPERTVTPRASGFIKGITLFDGGGWAIDWFNAGLTGPTIARMKNTVGANLAAFGDMLSLTQMDVATNTVTITNESGGLGVRAHYETMVAQARANSMAFMMILSIQPRGEARVPFTTLNQIPTTNTAFWDAFFAAYRARVLEKAAIARDLGIEYLSVGFNQSYLSRLEASRWRDLIRDVRALGYSGKVLYFASIALPNGFHELATVPTEFPALFDMLGFKIAGGVTAARGEVLATAQPRTRMRADFRSAFDRITALLATSNTPYLVMPAFPSVHIAASTTITIEPSLTDFPIMATYPRDYMQQADLYQAVAEVINERAGDSRIAGVVAWNYLWHDDFGRGGNSTPANTVAFDKTSSVRDKPAEAVLKWWFQRW